MVKTVDPNAILFSMPTMSSDRPQLEKVEGKPTDADFVLHEDDWRQIEFLPRDHLSEVKRTLTELKAFDEANRAQYGWHNIYVRRISETTVIGGGSKALQHLESVLGAKAGPAPILHYSTSAITGRVRNGFSLPLGGNITLYGYVSEEGIPVLGASVGSNPDGHKLTDAFTKLNSSDGLLLVDWSAQLVLELVGSDGKILAWQP